MICIEMELLISQHKNTVHVLRPHAGPTLCLVKNILSSMVGNAAKYRHKQLSKSVRTAAQHMLLSYNFHSFRTLGSAHTGNKDPRSTSRPTVQNNTLLS